jgi:hypothetical protein
MVGILGSGRHCGLTDRMTSAGQEDVEAQAAAQAGDGETRARVYLPVLQPRKGVCRRNVRFLLHARLFLSQTERLTPPFFVVAATLDAIVVTVG